MAMSFSIRTNMSRATEGAACDTIMLKHWCGTTQTCGCLETSNGSEVEGVDFDATRSIYFSKSEAVEQSWPAVAWGLTEIDASQRLSHEVLDISFAQFELLQLAFLDVARARSGSEVRSERLQRALGARGIRDLRCQPVQGLDGDLQTK